MTARAVVIVGAGCLGLGLALGVAVEGWRLGAVLEAERTATATQRQQVAEQHAAALLEEQQQRQALQGRLHTVDATYTERLTHARTETARLAADLRAATRRLSIRTATPAACPGVPAAPGAAGLDPAGGRAEIHGEDAAALVGIVGEADACAVTLTALQAWAREVTRPR